MQIFANEMTQMNIIREFPYAFAETRYPGVPEIHINQIDMDPFTVGDITVTPILVWHMRMPVLGFRFGNFTYITDANRIDAAEMDKIRGSSHLVLNALRHEKHISHFTLSEAVAVAQELKVPNVYFTHISHQLGLHELINAGLPPGIQLAYDGLIIHA
jgi:phosphoribosyl 1,2-cyclic phosphate phosphodiesterase